MECPKCQTYQAETNLICSNCGLVFAKYHARQQSPNYHKEIKQRIRRSRQLHTIEPKGWRYLTIGVVVGLLFIISDFWLVNASLGVLITLVHEMGHTAMAWLFGYPALPAFDFVHGGGMTINFDRHNGILLFLYALFIYAIYYYRDNRTTLLIILGLGCVHTLFAYTRLGEIFTLFMGHGTELVIAGVFIYRAMTSTSIVHEIERPMYSSIGFYIVFHDISFAWKLMQDSGYRVEYEAQKGGYHFGDFSRIAEQHLGVDLSVVAFMFLLCCLLLPVFSFLAWRFQEPVSDWLNERLIS